MQFMQKNMIKKFGTVNMRKVLTNIMLTFAVLLPMAVSASNENPTVNSEVVKDGSWDFNVTLSDISLSNDTEYSWSVVANQAAEPTKWYDVNSFGADKLNIKLDFSVQYISQVLASVDTVYIVVKEKQSETVVLNHIAVDVSIPYAYGAVPIKNAEGYWGVSGQKFVCSSVGLSCYEHRKYAAVKITDQNIIDSFILLKQQDVILDSSAIASFVDSLNLTSNDVPAQFIKEVDSSSFNTRFEDEKIGISDEGLYFVWGAQSYGSSKTVYGVTIYDNNYQPNSGNNNPGNNNPSTPSTDGGKGNTNSPQTSDTVKNPNTGVVSISLIGFVLVIAATYFVFKRKDKITKI